MFKQPIDIDQTCHTVGFQSAPVREEPDSRNMIEPYITTIQHACSKRRSGEHENVALDGKLFPLCRHVISRLASRSSHDREKFSLGTPEETCLRRWTSASSPQSFGSISPQSRWSIAERYRTSAASVGLGALTFSMRERADSPMPVRFSNSLGETFASTHADFRSATSPAINPRSCRSLAATGFAAAT